MTVDPYRRFLIASGTTNYAREQDRLGSVAADLATIVGFFKSHGYVEQLSDLRHDPTSEALRSQISAWLNDQERQDSDVVVVYYSGHGDTRGSLHYLLAANTVEDQYAGTGLRTDFLVEALGDQPKVRRLLVILDTCYSGQGAFNASELAAKMASAQNLTGPYEGVWVLAASRPREEADEGQFAGALVQAAEDLKETTGTLQRYIGLEALVDRINTLLQGQGGRQRASWTPATLTTGLAPFLVNPGYQSGAPAGVDLETRKWLQRRTDELSAYWGPKARGVEVAAQSGWYFTGRDQVLRELAGWLADSAIDTRMRVLTGDPGSGKSTVLGRLVVLADPQARQYVPPNETATASMFAEGAIAAALLARGKTGNDLRGELAAVLHLPTNADLAATLGARQPPVVVVVDALDEAADPYGVIVDFIEPLQAVATAGAGPRLLVGTRRPLLSALPADRVQLDLDQPSYLKQDDVVEYVTKVLLAKDDPSSPSPYRTHPDIARAVAGPIASIAGRNFLIAQVASRTLAHSPRPLSAEEVWADKDRWRDLGTAFDRDLARHGAHEQRVRDLLTPLAWAEGAGLPRELWAGLASVLASRSYSDADVTWLLGQAGAYIAEAIEQDRSVYRLYHQEFANHLRVSDGQANAQHAITATLLQQTRPLSQDARRDWSAMHPYVRTHLATHAALSGDLDTLVQDPAFLLSAAPERLLSALSSVTESQAQLAASAYEATRHLSHNRTAEQFAAQLQLAARQRGAKELADRVDGLPFQLPWTTLWARYSHLGRQLLIGRHAPPVHTVLIHEVAERPIVVTGAGDGTVRVWDLRTGQWWGSRSSGLTAIAAGTIDGQPIAATGGIDGFVRIWDLRTGRIRGTSVSGHVGGVTAVAVGELSGHPLGVTGGRDGSVRIWDLRTGQAQGPPMEGHTDIVTGVDVGNFDGRTIAVSGTIAGALEMWDLKTGRKHGRLLDNNILGKPKTPRLVGLCGLEIGELDGQPTLFTADYFCVRCWDLRSGRPVGARLESETAGITGLAVGQMDGRSVAVAGGEDGTVRLWDLASTALSDPAREGHVSVDAVAVGELDGRHIAVIAGEGRLEVVDLHSGQPLEVQPDSDEHWVHAMALGRLNGRTIAVAGDLDGDLCMWDLRTGRTQGSPMSVGRFRTAIAAGTPKAVARGIWTLAFGQVDERPIVVSGGADGRIRTWDPLTGKRYRSPLKGHTKGGVLSVAMGELDGRSVVVSGGLDETVRVWGLRTGRQECSALRGHEGPVDAVATGELDDGRPVAVSGGRDGTVRVWDLHAGVQIGPPLRGSYVGGISAVVVGELGDRSAYIASGARDGTIRVWDLKSRNGPAAELETGGPVDAIAASHDSLLVASRKGVFVVRLQLVSVKKMD